MCSSNFNDHSIIDMDADVITIENSQDEELLSVFREGIKKGAGIGPVLETNILWVNPDCGLKTRKYAEVNPALKAMVDAAKLLRTQLASAK
ncbi:hypothetical protein AgCh_019068 [Apium graveolens]